MQRNVIQQHSKALYVLAMTIPLLVIQYGFGAPELALVVAILCVVILGIPHGALDYAIANKAGLIGDARRKLVFIIAYLAMSAAVVVVWISFPTLTLLAFLLYSAYHFGDDWRQIFPPSVSFIGGTFALALPVMFHSGEVADIFSALAAAPEVPITVLSYLGYLAAITLTIAIVVQRDRKACDIVIQAGALVVLAMLFHPLVYFAVYFCAIHAHNHHQFIARQLSLKVTIAMLAVPTLATLALMSLAFVALWLLGIRVTDAGLQVLFIGLAALTVPHIILLDRIHTNRTFSM